MCSVLDANDRAENGGQQAEEDHERAYAESDDAHSGTVSQSALNRDPVHESAVLQDPIVLQDDDQSPKVQAGDATSGDDRENRQDFQRRPGIPILLLLLLKIPNFQ